MVGGDRILRQRRPPQKSVGKSKLRHLTKERLRLRRQLKFFLKQKNGFVRAFGFFQNIFRRTKYEALPYDYLRR